MPKLTQIAAPVENLTLPVQSESQLRAIVAARVGTVIITCDSGDSGAERARAAEALARFSGGALMRVDLARVMSQYIGETEKNLSQLFARAAESNVVLFFDEADALFGKRSDVKDSHDRFANVDVTLLLQKLEAYRGLVVVATSGKAPLDPTVLRRLRHVVALPTTPGGGLKRPARG